MNNSPAERNVTFVKLLLKITVINLQIFSDVAF